MIRAGRVLAAVGAGALLPVLCYAAAAVIGAAIPVNRGFVPVPGGTPVWLCSNGVHTDLVIAAAAGPVDWPALLPPGLFRAVPAGANALGFGWGDRDFYLTTPSWRDLRLATALHAVTGTGTTVVHIEWRRDGRGDPACRELRVDAGQMARLDAELLAAMAHDDDGRPRAIAGAGYGGNDGFVVGTGHYSIFLTCNEWLRRILAGAGIRTALWSPFPFGVMEQATAATR